MRLFGRDPFGDGVRALAGVAGFVETPRFYPYPSAQANLELLAALDGGGAAERIDESLALVDLNGGARDRVGTYSFGMVQRLGIAASLLREPRLLGFDEPTTGLDPRGQRDVRALIRRLAVEPLAPPPPRPDEQTAEPRPAAGRDRADRSGRPPRRNILTDVALFYGVTASYAGGYGVGVPKSICAAYFASIAARISRGLRPRAFICITSRVTPRQTPQVGAIGSKTTDPSAFTRLT